MPIPQKVFFLWNGPESPFQNLIKRTFARGLLSMLGQKTGIAQN
ncbi:hypothetical protein QUB70_11990 [Microcoleus sp. A003_D6]